MTSPSRASPGRQSSSAGTGEGAGPNGTTPTNDSPNKASTDQASTAANDSSTPAPGVDASTASPPLQKQHSGDKQQADEPIAEDPAVETDSSAKTQKIMLVFGRKRKAPIDDDMTTVSSELHTPNATTPPTDQANHAADATVPGDKASAVLDHAGNNVVPDATPSATNSLTNSSAPAAADSAAGPGTAASNTHTTNTPTTTAGGDASVAADAAVAAAVAAAEEKPKRAPRKRRKWLRRGEVDPDDPKAVAEQKARHALIDAAIEALDQQEQAVLDETHPQLVELLDELEKRRQLRQSYALSKYNAEKNELDNLRRQELDQIRFQFRVRSILTDQC